MATNRALVLTGGGARGAYQVGVLQYIAENIPEAHFNTLVGTSSGAINIAGLSSHQGKIPSAANDLVQLWSELEINNVFRVDIASIFMIGIRWLFDLTLGGMRGKPKAHYLVDTSPLEKLLRTVFKPEEVEAGIQSGLLRAVAVSATEVNTGSLVTFVQSALDIHWQRARRRSSKAKLTVEHIMASSAIPLVFPSVLVDNRCYVDGCIRSISPLSPATRLGAEKIFAIGVRRHYKKEMNPIEPNVAVEPEPKASAAQLGALILNSLFAESLDADVEHLERLNMLTDRDAASAIGMKKIETLVIRPSEDLGRLAVEFQSCLPWHVRYLLRGLGSERDESSDILSYLLFVPAYTKRLIQLGYEDASKEREQIKAFFS